MSGSYSRELKVRPPGNPEINAPVTPPPQKKVLVTGATGFVGRAVIPELLQAGFDVRASFRNQSAHQNSTPNVEWVSIPDLESIADFRDLVKGIDSVVHLAARVHQMGETGDASTERYREMNHAVTIRLAEAAVAENVTNFVFLSSIKVNGEATHGRPFTPTDPPTPEGAYACSKREAERDLEKLSQRSKMQICVIRSPLVYGPGAGGNLATLARSVQKGSLLPIGAIQNRRTLVSVVNLASLVVAAVNSASINSTVGRTPTSLDGISNDSADGRGRPSDEKAESRYFHVVLAGDEKPVSTPDIVRFIAQGMGRAPRLLSIPVALLRLAGTLTGRRGTIDRLCGDLEVDISQTRELLNWSPVEPTEVGLAKFGQAFKTGSQTA